MSDERSSGLASGRRDGQPLRDERWVADGRKPLVRATLAAIELELGAIEAPVSRRYPQALARLKG